MRRNADFPPRCARGEIGNSNELYWRQEVTMPKFIPGLELARGFYRECVRPLLDAEFPGLAHSAALLGSGSDVLGFDGERSTDHDWGPRVVIFLEERDHVRYAETLRTALSDRLPLAFRGHPTNFAGAPGEPGTLVMQAVDRGPVNHRVMLTTVRAFARAQLGLDPERELTVADWLLVPEQNLLAVTAGAVYHDGLDALEPLRRKLAYYPRDVWLYLLAAHWERIGQEEPFVGRAGSAGDELGSAVIAARLVRDVMRLCFLIERRYAPYPKWFGTAFARLACAPRLGPLLAQVLAEPYWPEREQQLCAAYELVAALHNELGLTPPLPARVTPFYDRPFRVIHGGAFADALLAAIGDEAVRALPRGVGKVDQWCDNTDVLSHVERCRRLGTLYATAAPR
jgi:hypothetical protein